MGTLNSQCIMVLWITETTVVSYLFSVVNIIVFTIILFFNNFKKDFSKNTSTKSKISALKFTETEQTDCIFEAPRTT